MIYKIYDFDSNASYKIEEFKSFEIKILKQNEFLIQNGFQKMSVFLGEVFRLQNKQYFLFDSQTFTFLKRCTDRKNEISKWTSFN